MKYLPIFFFAFATFSCTNKNVCDDFDKLDPIVDTLYLKKDFTLRHQNSEKRVVFTNLSFNKRDTAINSLFNFQKCGSDLVWSYRVDSIEWTFFLTRNENLFELTSLIDACITTINIDPKAKYQVLNLEHKINNRSAPKKIYMKDLQLYMIRDAEGMLWYRP